MTKKMKSLSGPNRTIDLSKIDEGTYDVKAENEGTRKLLEGFKMANVEIHLLSDDLDKVFHKKKFRDLFDIGVLSIHSCSHISEDMSAIFKKGARVHVETADFLVPLKQAQKQEFRKRITEKALKANWREVSDPPYNHHLLFEIANKEESTMASSTQEDDDDLTL